MQFDNVAPDTRAMFAWTETQTPAITNANINHYQTFTVTPPVPLKVGDIVLVSPPASGNAVTVGAAYVASATTISVAFGNTSAGNLTHAAGVFGFLVVRP